MNDVKTIFSLICNFKRTSQLVIRAIFDNFVFFR